MIPFRDNIPSRRYPLVTVAIILGNVAVFVYQLSLPSQTLEGFLFLYGVVPAKLRHIGQYPVQVFTDLGTSTLAAMFLHGGLFHLLGNMWYLWVFGDNVEDRIARLDVLQLSKSSK